MFFALLSMNAAWFWLRTLGRRAGCGSRLGRHYICSNFGVDNPALLLAEKNGELIPTLPEWSQ